LNESEITSSKNDFLFTDLFVVWQKNFPICGWYNKIQWRYGWKCPHFMYIVALVSHSCHNHVTIMSQSCHNHVTLVSHSCYHSSWMVCWCLLFSNTHSRMALTKWLPGFDEKSLAFEVLLAKCAIETLTVVIIIKSLDPSISSFNRESTGYTFCGK